MGFMRVTCVPMGHVVAEMTAFPLASEAAFRLAITELHPKPDPVPGRGVATDELWREAEQEMVRSCPNFSLDELIEIRDRLWYQCDIEEHAGTSLGDYLRRIAMRNLETRGNLVCPRLQASEVRDDPSGVAIHAAARRNWRWLAFALPPDLIVAGLRSPGDATHRPVSAVSPTMERMLADRGYVEPHLHVGAGMGFHVLWMATLRFLVYANLNDGAFQSPGAYFDQGRDFAAWLLRAAIARYLLAAFLSHRRQFGAATGTFAEFIGAMARPKMLAAMPLTWLTLIDVALRELAMGCFSAVRPRIAELQAAYAAMSGVGALPFPRQGRKIPLSDPVVSLLPTGCRPPENPEAVFVAEAICYLQHNAKDPAFAALFWQAVRVRNLFYRHIVQRPMTPGLQWFVRTYARISAGRKPVCDRLLVELAAEMCGLGRGLRSLEVRTCPGAHSELLRFVNECDRSFAQQVRNLSPPNAEFPPRSRGSRHVQRARQNPGPEFGIVLHFAKVRGDGAAKGRPKPFWMDSNADPKWGRNTKGYRYGSYYIGRREEAKSIAWLLMNFPRSLEVVRGVDVCTDEQGVPTWVIKPLYDYLRQVGERVSAHLGIVNARFPVPPLRFTAHAGEDFVHLLGGLRRVSESVYRLGLREGDRIGHGVALGVDAARWAENTGRVAVGLEERLFDLVWEWDCYSRLGVPCTPGRLAAVEWEIVELAKNVFGDKDRLTPHDMAQLVNDLHDSWPLSVMRFPDGQPPDPASDDRRALLLRRYLTDPDVFRRGHETKWIDPGQEGDALENLQTDLRRRMGAIGICVEVNPSSNLLIGNLGELQQHPLWRLRSPRRDDKQPPVSVCIGSDDPLTFAAELPAEYMLVHDALVLGKLSSDQADQWLDDVRQTGLDNRFTIPRSQPSRVTRYLNPLPADMAPPLL